MDEDEGRSGTPPELRRAFGHVLRVLRIDHGVTQEQLGFELGFHRTYISLLERGIKSPSLGAIFRIAAVLGVSPAELLQQVEAHLARGPDDHPLKATRRRKAGGT
jgi:transcriptional regulator with XRE-family HTH domain